MFFLRSKSIIFSVGGNRSEMVRERAGSSKLTHKELKTQYPQFLITIESIDKHSVLGESTKGIILSSIQD